jgi:hypothetical protein
MIFTIDVFLIGPKHSELFPDFAEVCKGAVVV